MSNWKDNFPKENRYYETKSGILYNADSVELLKEFPDKSIDLVLTDPPYNVSIKGNKICRTYAHYNWKRRSDIGLDFGKWDRAWKNDNDYFNWVANWFTESIRIIKDGVWIYIFFNKHKTGYFDLFLAPQLGIKTRTIYTWVKTNPVPSFRKVNWNSGTEHIWVGSKGKSKLKNFKYQKFMSNYFLSPNASAYKETNHPTEKPLSLLKHLVEVNSNKNEIVLDAFMGSGSVAVACEKLGRRWIGIEISPRYTEIAKKRIANEANQGKLFF